MFNKNSSYYTNEGIKVHTLNIILNESKILNMDKLLIKEANEVTQLQLISDLVTIDPAHGEIMRMDIKQLEQLEYKYYTEILNSKLTTFM
jgi:hypothetical protein